MKERELPLGVRIVSILNYISSFILLIWGIFLFASTIFIRKEFPITTATAAKWLFIIVAIIFILTASLQFFVARGLNRGKNWARYTSMALAIIIISSSIEFLWLGQTVYILSAILYFAILLYLMFSYEVKKFFS